MKSEEKEYIPIDDWTETKFPILKEDIECHLSQYVEADEVYDLRRLIFISLRQELEQK